MSQPRNRSFAELDLLFERRVPARKFATTKVDVFDETVDDSLINRGKEEQSTTHSEKIA